MDKRCPRKLCDVPTAYCPLAVLRLKAIRSLDHEPTEEEETNMPGCRFAIFHQLANYCLFAYLEKYSNADSPPSDMEIAHYLGVSVETVRKLVKQAIEKMKISESFEELEESRGDEPIMPDRGETGEYE